MCFNVVPLILEAKSLLKKIVSLLMTEPRENRFVEMCSLIIQFYSLDKDIL